MEDKGLVPPRTFDPAPVHPTSRSPAAGVTCPVCGEDGFDAGGLVRHIDRYCEAADGLRAEWARQDQAALERAAIRLKSRVASLSEFAGSSAQPGPEIVGPREALSPSIPTDREVGQ